MVGLGAEISSGGAALREVAGEDWLNEGAEDDLSATAVLSEIVGVDVEPTCDVPSLRECHPKDEHKFEGVVESLKILVT